MSCYTQNISLGVDKPAEMDLLPGIVNNNEGTLIGASVESSLGQYTVRILAQPFH